MNLDGLLQTAIPGVGSSEVTTHKDDKFLDLATNHLALAAASFLSRNAASSIQSAKSRKGLAQSGPVITIVLAKVWAPDPLLPNFLFRSLE